MLNNYVDIPDILFWACVNVSLSLASQHARSFHCNLCGSVDDSRLTTHLVFSSLMEEQETAGDDKHRVRSNLSLLRHSLLHLWLLPHG